ncbi:MAG: conjugal transfer protein TraC [Desulfobacteria bacterium]
MKLKNILFGADGGMKKSQLAAMTQRNKFSDYLPYMAYDPKTAAYTNTDETIGFIWECVPLVYMGRNELETLEGLFTLGLPYGTALQFMLYADPNIDPYTNMFQGLKTRHSGQIDLAEKTSRFYQDASKSGFKNMAGMPARNFRLFVSVKLKQPIDDSTALDIKNNIGEVLAGIHLHPRSLPPEDLIHMLMRLLNNKAPNVSPLYDETVPIRKQIILSETPIISKWDGIEVGDKFFRCLTVKKMAQTIDPLTFNEILGGHMGHEIGFESDQRSVFSNGECHF